MMYYAIYYIFNINGMMNKDEKLSDVYLLYVYIMHTIHIIIICNLKLIYKSK